jgi:hypothetical protein
LIDVSLDDGAGQKAYPLKMVMRFERRDGRKRIKKACQFFFDFVYRSY